MEIFPVGSHAQTVGNIHFDMVILPLLWLKELEHLMNNRSYCERFNMWWGLLNVPTERVPVTGLRRSQEKNRLLNTMTTRKL